MLEMPAFESLYGGQFTLWTKSKSLWLALTKLLEVKFSQNETLCIYTLVASSHSMKSECVSQDALL